MEMNDGSTWSFNRIPEDWKNVPAPQIPGVASITIKVTMAGRQLPGALNAMFLDDDSDLTTFHIACVRAVCVQQIAKPAGHFGVSRCANLNRCPTGKGVVARSLSSIPYQPLF